MTSYYAAESALLSFSGTTAHFVARTSTHLAGTDERGLLFVQASCNPVGISQSLGVRGAYQVDGGADTPIGPPSFQVNGTGNNIPLSNGNVGSVDLISGSSYVFSAALNNSIGGSPYTADCSAALIVMVVRR